MFESVFMWEHVGGGLFFSTKVREPLDKPIIKDVYIQVLKVQ